MWSDPYAVVDRIFRDAMVTSNNDVNIALDDMNEEELLSNEMLNEDFANGIPFLTRSSVGSLQSGQLCRFRGLVQDMYGNELYAGAIKAHSKGSGGREMRVTKYRDVLPQEYLGDSSASHDTEDYNECYRDR